MEEAKLTEVLLTIFSTLGVLVLMRALVAAAHEFMASRKRRDEEEAPYKLERPDGYPPLNVAVPENPYPIKPTTKPRRKYTKRSEYWKSGEAKKNLLKARAARAKKKKH